MYLTAPPAPHIDSTLVSQVCLAQRLFRAGALEDALAAWDHVLGPDGSGAGPRILSGALLGEVLLGRARTLVALARHPEALEALSQPLLGASLELMPPRRRMVYFSDLGTVHAALCQWEEAADALNGAAAVAAYELDSAGRAAVLMDRLMETLAEAGVWPLVEREAREAMTFARLSDQPSLAIRAGWMRVRALKALGRGALAQVQAQELLRAAEARGPDHQGQAIA